jgi:hypothetical protein
MKANASLSGPPGIIMEDAKTPEDFDGSIIRADGDQKLSFSHRPPEQFSGRIVEAEPIGNPIKLGLGQVKRIKRLIAHDTVPFPIKK